MQKSKSFLNIDFQEMNQPGHVLLSGILGLQPGEIVYNTIRKKRNAMSCILRASIFGILRHCLHMYMKATCAGCKIQALGQSSHECLSWNKKIISRKIRIICGRLCFKNILHVIILMGYSLNCLILTPQAIDKILILITKIGRSHHALKEMNKLLRKGEEPFLKHVMKMIQNRPYEWFLQL